jgi:mannosyl-oligosaccharide alpha-1,2-mannosidase
MILMLTANFYRTNPEAHNHMLSSNVVLAVLGTLSLEFTHLSQITRNNKYFDAIQRAMNELEKWQDNTGLPGMWPAMVNNAISTESMVVGLPSTAVLRSLHYVHWRILHMSIYQR